MAMASAAPGEGLGGKTGHMRAGGGEREGCHEPREVQRGWGHASDGDDGDGDMRAMMGMHHVHTYLHHF